MGDFVDQAARQQLAALVQQLAAGEITNRQFEDNRPCSTERALHDIFAHGLWPLYDDLTEHKLTGKRALTIEAQAHVARVILFLKSGLPYRYPRSAGIARLPVFLLSLATLGWFGRYWHGRLWRGADESVWPFYARNEYQAVIHELSPLP